MKLKDQPWPPGTEPIVRHNVLGEYIQEIPKREHIESLFRYDTRVVNVQKQNKVWRVESETLARNKAEKLELRKRVEVRQSHELN